MVGLSLLLAHLVGDYILQNDYLAKNKAADAVPPGPRPGRVVGTHGYEWYAPASPEEEAAWAGRRLAYWRPSLACTAHCLLYTAAVWAFTFAWMPWWGLAACFLAHWPLDRFRLAKLWMENVSGQAAFATGPLAPWSVIVVDNVFHLLTLYLIALAAVVR